MKRFKKILAVVLVLALAVPSSLSATASVLTTVGGTEHVIELNSAVNSDGSYTHSATVDGASVNEYDYTWHADPATDHGEVMNSPAEYYTGTAPAGDEAVYIAHDIYYFPELDESKFTQKEYSDDPEWVYFYEVADYTDYLFSTLPVIGDALPVEMMHSEEEAYANAVLHITEAGTYRLSGYWHGQILIDLGDESFDDPAAVVTLVLDDVMVECTVASGICFYQVYEVDSFWNSRETANAMDTTGAGANVIIADGTENNVYGKNIFRILKTKYTGSDSDSELPEQLEAHKTDGALYSYMSMNVGGEEAGTGLLYITSTYDGLDSELHLTINGGNINITSENDGINVNEDDVSIFTLNGGTVQILGGTGSEGAGVDSDGYININGGTLISSANVQSDLGLDSECGVIIDGGTVIAMGSSADTAEKFSEESGLVVADFMFAAQQDITKSFVITDTSDKAVFALDLSQNEFFTNSGRTMQSLVISDDALELNGEYHVYSGAKISGTATNGIYQEVTSFEDGQLLGYGGGGQGGFGGGGQGGFGGGGQMPDGMSTPDGMSMPEGQTWAEGETPSLPDGMSMPDGMSAPDGSSGGGQGGFGGGGQMPEGMSMPEGQTWAEGETPSLPDGMSTPDGSSNGGQGGFGGGGQMPEGMSMPEGQTWAEGETPSLPDGMSAPDGFDPEGMSGFDPGSMNMGNQTTVFKLSSKVNTFANVAVYTEVKDINMDSTKAADDGTVVATDESSVDTAIIFIIVGVAVAVAAAVVIIILCFKPKKKKKEDIEE